MGNNMTYLYDTIPIKTRLKMLAARTAGLTEGDIRMLEGK